MRTGNKEVIFSRPSVDEDFFRTSLRNKPVHVVLDSVLKEIDEVAQPKRKPAEHPR